MVANNSLRVGDSSYTGPSDAARLLYIRALEINRLDTSAWNELGVSLPFGSGDEVTIGGVRYTRLACFMQALEIDPNLGVVWGNLSTMLSADSEVTIRGASYNQRDCFLRALENNPELAGVWANLAVTLSADSEVVIRGASFDQRACFVRALELNPVDAIAWDNLGATMVPGSEIVVSGTVCTQESCLMRARAVSQTTTSQRTIVFTVLLALGGGFLSFLLLLVFTLLAVCEPNFSACK